MSNNLELLRESIWRVWLRALLSCVKSAGRNFRDILMKFVTLMCFNPRTNVVENGSDWITFSTSFHLTPYLKNRYLIEVM